MHPSKEELLHRFIYDQHNGLLYWRNCLSNHRRNGKQFGTFDPSTGYIGGNLGYKKYLVHRLIYFLHYGAIPKDKYIDHIDGNRLNNRITNLQLVDATQNSQNRTLQRNNKSGYHGVYWHKANSNWVVEIHAYNLKYRLGSFRNLEDAVAARKDAEARLGFSKRHGQRKTTPESVAS